MSIFTEEQRRAAQPFWAGFVLFFALFYLTGSFLKAAVISIFVLVSCLLEIGQRWLLRGSLAVVIVAIAVVLGFPEPDQWGKWLQDARQTLAAGTSQLLGPCEVDLERGPRP